MRAACVARTIVNLTSSRARRSKRSSARAGTNECARRIRNQEIQQSYQRRLRRTTIVASTAREGDERATEPRKMISQETMDVMLGRAEASGGGRGARGAGRVAALATACVVAGALGGGLARVSQMPATATTGTPSITMKERVANVQSNGTYVAQRVFGWPLYGKVFIIMTAMVPLVLAAASVYKHVSDSDWNEAIANAYYWLNDVPGADSTAEESLKTTVVAQLIVFCGMFTFAILIGVVSDEIASKVDEVRNGNHKVYEKNHTVILNWNDQLIPLLKQIAVAKQEGIGFDKPIVLLADMEKETMDNVIQDELADSPPLTVVTRQGQAHNSQDLDRVNAWSAERVIVLHDGSSTDPATIESQKATAVLNLRAKNFRSTTCTGPNVIVQVPHRLEEIDDSTSLAIDLTDRPGHKNGEYAFVNGTSELSRLKAFSAMQPGGNQLFEDLMLQSNDSAEFYTFASPSLAGMTFQDAWRLFNTATLVGIVNEDGMILGPKDDAIIGERGEIVVIAENKSEIARNLTKGRGKVKEGVIPRPGTQNLVMEKCPIKMPSPKKLFVIGWNEESPGVVHDMLLLAPPGSSVTIIANDDIDKKEMKGSKYCSVKHVKMDAKKMATLKSQRVHEADSILIMPTSEDSDATQDSHVLATVMQIAHLVTNSTTPYAPHLVTELSCEVAKQVAEDVYRGIGTVDIILHDNLIGGTLLQVSANLKLAGMFDFLLEKEGKELYMRPHDEFVTVNDTDLYWGELCERARVRDEIAVGVMHANGELQISPRKDQQFRLCTGDRVVVLAEDWWTPQSVKAKTK